MNEILRVIENRVRDIDMDQLEFQEINENVREGIFKEIMVEYFL